MPAIAWIIESLVCEVTMADIHRETMATVCTASSLVAGRFPVEKAFCRRWKRISSNSGGLYHRDGLSFTGFWSSPARGGRSLENWKADTNTSDASIRFAAKRCSA
jgi:hypothetical protein